MDNLKNNLKKLSINENLTIALFMGMPTTLSLLLLININLLITGPKAFEEIKQLELELMKIEHPNDAISIMKESQIDVNLASIHESYYLNWSLDEIGKYYQDIFEKQGWKYINIVVYSSYHANWTYCKGEYTAAVEYYNYGSTWTYDIWMDWGNQGCNGGNGVVSIIIFYFIGLFISLIISLYLGLHFYRKFAYKKPDSNRRLLPIVAELKEDK